MKRQMKFISGAAALLLILVISIPVSTQQFVNSGQSLPGLYAGSAHWGFYDPGSTPDLVLTGLSDSGEPVTLVYKTVAGALTEVSSDITGVYFGEAVWGDYDNDGDADIALAGLDSLGNSLAEVWRNNDGIFELDTDQDLTGLRYATVAWGDVNNDGYLDLITTGLDRFGSVQTILYKNQGRIGVDSYPLVRETAQSFLNIAKGSAAFGDFDNDGDLDLVLSGIDASGFPNAAFYVNDPVGFFIYDTKNSPMIQKLSNGSLNWADYDNDGFIDLVQTGLNSYWQAIIVLYENEHNGRIGDNVLTTAQDLAGSAVTGDFDNDGDFDIVAVGKDHYSNLYFSIQQRQSNNTFTETQLPSAALRDGAVAAADYDLDGKLDLLVSGVNNSGQFQTVLYTNTTVAASFTPQPPASLHPVIVTNDQIILSWDNGSDDQTPTEILTYNIRIGDQSNENSVLSGVVPVGPGNAGNSVGLTLNTRLAEGQYTWSVQTVNAQHKRSDWSQEDLFWVEQFVSSPHNIAGFQFAASAWGDVDNDGDPDLVVAGTDANSNNRAVMYVNNNGLLVEDFDVNSDLVKFNYGDFAWGDVDNDGDIDLAYAGFFIRQSATSGLYINDNGTLIEQQNVFAQVGFASLDWGDYDNDGDIDLAVMGKTSDGPFITKIYTNDAGVLAEDTVNTLPGYANGALKWVDYDNDGDLDLAITGQHFDDNDLPDNKIRLFKNGPAGTLTEDAANSLPEYQSSDFAWADIDDDGDLDMIVSGWSDGDQTAKTAVFINDPAGTFTEDATLSAGLTGVYGGSIAFGDYDNDGDPDLILSGFDGTYPLLKLYKKQPASFEEEILNILDNRGVDFSSVSLIDVDADGDLELATVGRLFDGSNYSSSSNIYDNVNAPNNANTPPEQPAILTAEVSNDTVFLTWQPVLDPPLGGGLRDYQTYQIRVDSMSGGDEIVSGAVLPGIGSFGSTTSRMITGLVSGDYSWSVRAVDNGLAASDWSFEQTFRVDTDPPVVSAESVTSTPDSAGIGTVTIFLNITENFELDFTALPMVKAILPDSSTQDVEQFSYAGKTWIGELEILESYESGNVSFLISGIKDAIGNEMSKVTAMNRLNIDTERPEIVSTTPISAQEDIETRVTLTATFSEQLNSASIDNTVLKLYRGDTEVITQDNVDLIDNGFTLQRVYAGLAGDTEFRGTVIAKVEDKAGNRMESFYSWTFKTAKIVSALSGGSVFNADSSIVLYFSPTALPADAEISIEAVTPSNLPGGVTFANVAYHIGPEPDLSLSKPSKLIIHYDDTFPGQSGIAKTSALTLVESKLAVYRQDGNDPTVWEKIGGTVETVLNTVTCSVSKLGTFGLFEDLTVGAGTESISDISFTPRVFAPNGSGILPRETSINFVLGKEMNVTILIFNISGRPVRRLMDSRSLNSGRQSVVWNGLNADGNVCPSGLYTVVVKAGGITEIKTVAISNK